MSGIVFSRLGDAPFGDLSRVIEHVRELDVPGHDDVEGLRIRVRAALQDSDIYVLAVGAGAARAAHGAASSSDVARVLRVAFALSTGAARYPAARIVIALPAAALLPDAATPDPVVLRSLLGMAEALRAELLPTTAQLSILFHAAGEDGTALLARAVDLADSGEMYGMSHDLTAERISAYFAPMRRAIADAPAGSPLPDIGPMAQVYTQAVANRAHAEKTSDVR
ncbi:hypothetical protein ACIQLJ_01400 [Microbacterium sp. NPDC091313]